MQRRQARAMFRFADEPGCRHQRLVGHFGEVAGPCGDACDACGLDPPVRSSTAASPGRRSPPGRTPRRGRRSSRG
jgi:ATP-dependent DNA helicase RecQ